MPGTRAAYSVFGLLSGNGFSDKFSIPGYTPGPDENLTARGLIVGLDCEWKPNYQSWTTSKVAILQLCVGTSCLVLQMFYANRVPAAIRSLLGCWPRPRRRVLFDDDEDDRR